MKERLLKSLMGVLCVFMVLLSSTSYAQELVEETSKTATEIVQAKTDGTLLKEEDPEYADANRITINPYGYVRLTVDDDKAVNMHYEYSLTAEIWPLKSDGTPDDGAKQTKTLKIVYNPLCLQQQCTHRFITI